MHTFWITKHKFCCSEEIDDLAAFQRQYENDHSWEDLREDEFGRLLSLVGNWLTAISWMRHFLIRWLLEKESPYLFSLLIRFGCSVSVSLMQQDGKHTFNGLIQHQRLSPSIYEILLKLAPQTDPYSKASVLWPGNWLTEAQLASRQLSCLAGRHTFCYLKHFVSSECWAGYKGGAKGQKETASQCHSYCED